MQRSHTAIVALVAMLLTACALWLTNRTIAPKEATWDDVVAESSRGSYRLIIHRGIGRTLPVKWCETAADRYPPGMGVSDRAHHRSLQFSDGADLVGTVAQGRGTGEGARAGFGAAPGLLLSRLDLSPQ